MVLYFNCVPICLTFFYQFACLPPSFWLVLACFRFCLCCFDCFCYVCCAVLCCFLIFKSRVLVRFSTAAQRRATKLEVEWQRIYDKDSVKPLQRGFCFPIFILCFVLHTFQIFLLSPHTSTRRHYNIRIFRLCKCVDLLTLVGECVCILMHHFLLLIHISDSHTLHSAYMYVCKQIVLLHILSHVHH